MSVYRENFEIAAEGLSTRLLFWMLQESAGHHSAALGYGEQRMEELGVMWVVIRYVVNCERWPRPGETVTVEVNEDYSYEVKIVSIENTGDDGTDKTNSH